MAIMEVDSSCVTQTVVKKILYDNKSSKLRSRANNLSSSLNS